MTIPIRNLEIDPAEDTYWLRDLSRPNDQSEYNSGSIDINKYNCHEIENLNNSGFVNRSNGFINSNSHKPHKEIIESMPNFQPGKDFKIFQKSPKEDSEVIETDKGVKYMSTWLKKKNGCGKEIWDDGTVYEGTFFNAKLR